MRLWLISKTVYVIDRNIIYQHPITLLINYNLCILLVFLVVLLIGVLLTAAVVRVTDLSGVFFADSVRGARHNCKNISCKLNINLFIYIYIKVKKNNKNNKPLFRLWIARELLCYSWPNEKTDGCVRISNRIPDNIIEILNEQVVHVVLNGISVRVDVLFFKIDNFAVVKQAAHANSYFREAAFLGLEICKLFNGYQWNYHWKRWITFESFNIRKITFK